MPPSTESEQFERLLQSRDPGVTEDDEASTVHGSKVRSSTRIRQLLKLTVFGLVSATVLYLSILGAISVFYSITVKSSLSCGNSPAEAASLGCRFDISAALWVPEECYFDDIVQSFREERNWQYYRHREGLEPIAEEEVLQGRQWTVYTEWEYHRYHCFYMWLKLQRVARDGGWIDSDSVNEKHIQHCGRILLEPHGAGNRTQTGVATSYATCLYIRGR